MKNGLKYKKLPDVGAQVDDSYGELLAHGFDTLVESFNVNVPHELEHRMKEAKKNASDRDLMAKDGVLFNLGGEELTMSARGAKGAVYWMQNKDFAIYMRPTSMDYCLSVRYSSEALWRDGVIALQKRIDDIIYAEFYPKISDEQGRNDFVKVSEVHYAFDFFSPKLTLEMKPSIIEQIVCHSSTKKTLDFNLMNAWGRGDYLETITIGRGSPCSIQIYDKGKEITEVSGKTWMMALWGMDENIKPVHCWRLEIRMRRKGFLKKRNINNFDEVIANLSELIAGALKTKRLTVKSGDKNRSRWLTHPLWHMAHEASGMAGKMLCIQEVASMQGNALDEMLRAQAAGLLRAMSVLKYGVDDPMGIHEIAMNCVNQANNDPDADIKADKLMTRYRDIHVIAGETERNNN